EVVVAGDVLIRGELVPAPPLPRRSRVAGGESGGEWQRGPRRGAGAGEELPAAEVGGLGRDLGRGDVRRADEAHRGSRWQGLPGSTAPGPNRLPAAAGRSGGGPDAPGPF